MPVLRAAETLILVGVLFIVMVAGLYVEMSASDPASFTQPIDKVAGIYFATTIFTTVGFGDITAVSAGARIAVIVQMVLDLVILAFLARIVVAAARTGMSRRSVERKGDTGE